MRDERQLPERPGSANPVCNQADNGTCPLADDGVCPYANQKESSG
jgi:hypothetical protein